MAEHWLQTQGPNVITLFEAECIDPIMAATSTWDGVFEFGFVPAVGADEGMEIARRLAAA